MKLAYPTELLEQLPYNDFIYWHYNGWIFTSYWIATGNLSNTNPIPREYASWALDIILKTEPVNYSPQKLIEDRKTGFYTVKSNFDKNIYLTMNPALKPLLTYHKDSKLYPVLVRGPTPYQKGIWSIGIFAEILGEAEVTQEQDNVRKIQRLRAIVIPETPILY